MRTYQNAKEGKVSMKQYNILFLCTHNSARSVLGEALASTHLSGKFIGYSAGSTPGNKVNPFAAEIAKELGYPESKLRSKRRAFRDVMIGLKKRLDLLAEMPLETLDSLSLKEIHTKS